WLQSPVYRLSMCAFPLMILTTALPVLNSYVLMCGVFFLCGALAERVWRQERAVQAAGVVFAGLMAVFVTGLAVPNGLTMLLLGVAAVILAAN
ncbi:hypothetical protein, partial [Escherichia coli]|uniref:hypothetical protein n=1 Tax=Escherichia coli TaxID=562 RepID=UPI003458FFCB